LRSFTRSHSWFAPSSRGGLVDWFWRGLKGGWDFDVRSINWARASTRGVATRLLTEMTLSLRIKVCVYLPKEFLSVHWCVSRGRAWLILVSQWFSPMQGKGWRVGLFFERTIGKGHDLKELKFDSVIEIFWQAIDDKLS
jgi:hypothetical protein